MNMNSNPSNKVYPLVIVDNDNNKLWECELVDHDLVFRYDETNLEQAAQILVAYFPIVGKSPQETILAIQLTSDQFNEAQKQQFANEMKRLADALQL